MGFRRAHAVAALTAAVVIALDQWTKALATASLGYGEARDVLPFLAWRYVNNAGAAFGFLAAADPVPRMVFFAVVGLAAVFVVTVLAWRARSNLSLAAYALIFGGAAGNFIDRVRLGSVVDFIDVHAGDLHWWVFNVADIAVTAGVGLLLIEGYLLQRAVRAARSS